MGPCEALSAWMPEPTLSTEYIDIIGNVKSVFRRDAVGHTCTAVLA